MNNDRFIFSREQLEFSKLCTQMEGKENTTNDAYCCLLQDRLQLQKDAQILKPSFKAPIAYASSMSNLQVLFSCNKIGGHMLQPAKCSSSSRSIPSLPERVLDAPGLTDDYYLNLLDWSCQNMLAVALGNAAYIWNGETGAITELTRRLEWNNYISSISCSQDGNFIAVGTNASVIHIFDAHKMKQVRTLVGHDLRIGSMHWNGPILTSGGKDSRIINHDVRIREHQVAHFEGHSLEVCGLKWDPHGRYLASGSNDNLIHVWDINCTTKPVHSFAHHTAAVKALAWCPWQSHILVTGGGTADRKMNFFNTSTGSLLNSIDTKSQVCALLWSKYDRELLSSHGFSQHQLTIWKYPALVKLKELTGHTNRVLHLAMSPDGTTVASCSSDETIRFWRVFSQEPASKTKQTSPSKLNSVNHFIR